MGYWLKYFIDGSTYRGTDAAVAAKKASWRKSPSCNMTGVELVQGQCKLEIHGLGTYWQSEQMESTFPRTNTIRIRRRIERKIVVTDTHFRVVAGPGGTKIVFNGRPLGNGHWFPVKKTMHNKWLILEYDMRTKRARYFFKDNRV